MASGVVSMAQMPPSVVYSVSGPSSSSPHILPKHAAPPSAVLHSQPHPERHVDRHLPPDRSADRQSDSQVDILAHSERQTTASNSNSSAAPPSGSAVSTRSCSPPLQIQAPGRTASSVHDTVRKPNLVCKTSHFLVNRQHT